MITITTTLIISTIILITITILITILLSHSKGEIRGWPDRSCLVYRLYCHFNNLRFKSSQQMKCNSLLCMYACMNSKPQGMETNQDMSF